MTTLAVYEEILSQMGVDSEEYSEGAFNDSKVDEELELDLYSWFPDYASLLADSTGDSVVALQKKAIKLYARVFCAHSIMITSPMRFLQQTGDGDNASRRFQTDSSLNDFITSLEIKKNKARSTVLGLTTDYTPTDENADAVFPGMAISSPSVDKITGE